MPTCKLCGLDKPLENSHYPFPAFIFKWMKRSGGSIFRRPGANPNIPYQDGEQARLLCGECEDLFQTDESLFARRVFQPIVNGQYGPMPYDQFLARFLVSILWRHLSLSLAGPDPGMGSHRALFVSAEEEWRNFLLKRGELAQFGRIHLFITDVLSNSEHNLYLARAVDATVVTSGSGRCGVYAKFARFVIFAELSDNFDAAQWENTRINHGSGVLLESSPQVIKDVHFGSFLQGRAEIVKDLMKKVIPAQASKIGAHAKANASRIAASELGLVLTADGIARSSVPKVGRNDPCPCGLGRKYKKCHGA